MRGPLFGALDALAVHDRCRRTRLFAGKLARLLVKRKVQAIERATTVPTHEPVVNGGARGKVLRQLPPLAAGGQNVENGVENVAAPRLPGLRRIFAAGDEGFHQGPFRVGLVARVAQALAVILRSALARPHRSLLRDRIVHRITSDSVD